jgi:hypothetical protein
MYLVEIYKNGVVAFGSTFSTEEEAIEWVENHSSGIKDYKVINDIDHNRKQKIAALKDKRDAILCATDWIFLPDLKFDQKHRRIYMEYRQVLRDVPQNLRKDKPVTFESFDHWVKRKHPEEFMDGGNGQKIIYRFKYYYKKHGVNE